MFKVLLLAFLLASASFAWLDPAFQYRMPINISSSSNLTDYQVQVSPNLYNNTGLVGSWHFSEGSGARTADASGFGNDGTLAGGPAWVSGKAGYALAFDGIDDSVSIPSSDSLTSMASITLETWIKADPTQPDPGASTILRRDSNTGSPRTIYNTYLDAGGKVAFQFMASSGGLKTGACLTDLRDNSWHHAVVMRDAASARVYCYIDGVKETDVADATTGNFISNPATPLYIGQWNVDGGNRRFKGSIDEVRIYNRSLSAQEIQAHYNSTKARLDYADIRFALANDTALPYWFESDIRSWVKVPNISAAGTAIHMYYGNASAASASNGTATFDVFDDFEGYSIGSTGSPAWTVNAAGFTVQSDGTQVLKKGGTESGSKSIRPVAQQNISVDMRLKHLDSLFYTQPLIGDASTYYSLLVGAGGLSIYDPLSGPLTTTAFTPVQGAWYDVSLARNGSTLTGRAGGKTVAWSGMSISSLNAGVRMGGTYVGEIDDFRVRKYSASEPIASSGAEEQLDSTLPVVLISLPNSSLTYFSASVPLNFTASDASGVSSCKYELNGVNTTLPGCLNATINASSGSNSLRVWAYDGTNWGSSSASFNVQLDTAPPLISISSPEPRSYSSASVPVSFVVSDATAVDSCIVRLNGTINSTTCSNYSLTLGNGAYALNITANDTFGNVNSSAVSFNVSILPSVSNSTTTDSNGIGNVSLNGIPQGASRIVYSVGSNSYLRSFSVSSGVSSVRFSARATLQGTPASGKALSFNIS